METSEFNRIYNAYAAQLLFFAQKIMKQREDAEDIVSKAFIQFWKNHDKYQVPAKHLLYLIVRNLCLDELRKRQRRQVHEIKLEIPSSEDIERYIITADFMDLVYSNLACLPPKSKEVFIKTYFEGLRADEIAEIMKITVTNVTSQRGRAITLLRNKLKED
jgi:RNA polymerase sigma-70 factor (family 1)